MLDKNKSIIAFLDNMPNSVCIKDKYFRYQYVNRAYCEKVLGIKEEDYEIKNIIGKTAREISDKEWIKTLEEADQKVLNTEKLTVFELRIFYNNFHCSLHILESPLIDEEQGFLGAICIEEHMRGQSNILEEMIKGYNQITTGYRRSNIISNNPQGKELLRAIAEALSGSIYCDASAIYWHDQEKNALVLYTSKGLDKNLLKSIEKIDSSQESLQEYFSKEENRGIRSVSKVHSRYRRKAILSDIIYCATYPVQFEEVILGVVFIGYRSDNFFPAYADHHMNNLCNKVAMLIKNALLIDELEHQSVRIKEAERKLECFLNTTTDLMCVLDENYYIKRINSEWHKKLGWMEEEIIGNPISKFIKGEFFTPKRKEQVRISTVHCLCKDGSMKLISWNIVSLPHVNLVIATGRDITEIKAIKLSNTYLLRAIEEERLKNDFFANISHEFKTPLNIILSSMQLLDKYIEDEKANEDISLLSSKYIYKIKKNAYRLLRIANNLIDTTKLETGNYVLQCHNYNIVTIVEDVTLAVAQYLKDEGVTILFDTQTEEEIVYCDIDNIERIMLCLLSNAVKNISDQGQIMVKLKATKTNVEISVKDTGCGIKEDRLENIFDSYTQSRKNIEGKEKELGVGLSIVKALVKLHGGNISVKSTLNQGTEFIFDIPNIKIDKEVRTRDNHNCPISLLEKCIIEFS